MTARARLPGGLALLLCACLLAGGCRSLPASAPVNSATAAPAAPPATREKTAAPAPVVVSSWQADTLADLLIGEVAGQRGQLELAVESYLRQAEQLRSPEIAARATRIAWFARMEAEARRAATLWAELAPDDPEANANAVMGLVQAGEIEAAAPLLARLLENPSQPLRFNFLVQYARDAAPEMRARIGRLMEDLSRSHPDNARLWLARAALEEIDNRHDRSLEYVRRARAIEPDDVATLDLEGRLLLVTGQAAEARRLLKPATRRFPQERDIQLGYLRALLESGRSGEARRQLVEMLSRWPDDNDLSFSLALLDWESSNADAGLERMVALAEAGFREDEAWMYAGRMAASQKKYDEASGYFQNVRGSSFIQAQIQLANAWQLAGRLADARTLLANLRQQSPETAATLHVAESDLLWRAGAGAESLAVLELALTASPDDKDLRYAYALAAERINRIDIAERELRALVEASPENPMLLNALGYTLADRTDRHAEAKEFIDRAILLSPDDPAIIDSMGWVNYRLGNLVEAERWLRRAASLNAEGEIAAHLGEVLWVAGKRREARRTWERARARDPDNPVLRRTMARFLE